MDADVDSDIRVMLKETGVLLGLNNVFQTVVLVVHGHLASFIPGEAFQAPAVSTMPRQHATPADRPAAEEPEIAHCTI